VRPYRGRVTVGSVSGVDQWLLSSAERNNDATELDPWTTGNAVRALVDGWTYFAAFAAALENAAAGDLVLLVGWRIDADRVLTDEGLTLVEALRRAVDRGVAVKGLVWRSHPTWLVGTARQNRRLVRAVNAAGGELLSDHRVRALGSHHQKFVVIRHRNDSARDVAFVGGIDLAKARRDESTHRGDPLSRPFAAAYGPSPAWHDVQLELRGPVVEQVEKIFRERWDDPKPMTRLPWHAVPDRLRGLPQHGQPLPTPASPPPPAGACVVQLLRTYPSRRPGYPFAPRGERSVARGFAKALECAQRLVYVEDQYLWSAEVAHLFARALRRNPRLQVIAVAPRLPDREGLINVPPQLFGQQLARSLVREAGAGRVHRFDVENDDGWPIYIHAKVTIVDDTWAAVGSANLNRRSWTHDSELTAAVLDQTPDPRKPVGAGGCDATRRVAHELRIRLMGEHLGRNIEDGNDLKDLCDPEGAVRAFVESAEDLDDWYRSGRTTPRPPGRIRSHALPPESPWRRRLAPSLYNLVFDPDGRPRRTRLRRAD
jgi:phosphatidylserine/phosphatidylglycerophosphate/cardiolipin synthase-like enzyme